MFRARRPIAAELRAHVRIAEHERAEEKEHLDAEKTRDRYEDERKMHRSEVDVRIEPRDLPKVVPHDQGDRDPAQSVERVQMVRLENGGVFLAKRIRHRG